MLQLWCSSRLGVLVTLCAFLLASEGRAQIQSGTITGTVVDASSASVPDTQVTATNEATGAARNQTTNESGSFNFAGLPPGNYTVRVEKSGFRPVVQPGLVLTA